MDFFLFLVLNAVLFIRPAEIIPAVTGWPIYNSVIILNLIAGGPAIINHLRSDNLVRSPVTVCVFGVLVFVVMSHLVRFDLWSARYGGWEFAKVVIYFLLLVTTLSTPKRFFSFLAFLVGCVLAVNALAVLQYHSYIDIPALTVLMENDYDELTGEISQTPRMRSTGIFNDPNDLSMIIVAAIILCIAGICHKSLGAARALLFAPAGFLLYCLTLTQSRGGLLALIAGCGAIMYSRFGAMRTGLAAAAGIPLILVGFGGRQVDIGGAMSGGSGHSRVELWSEGLRALKQSPVLGVGYGLYADHAGQVAHNAFVHAFTELGIMGGMMFLGVFYLNGIEIWRLRKSAHEIKHTELRFIQPYLFGMLVAYSISMFSLSRGYVIPTYLVAGLCATHFALAGRDASLKPMRFDGKLVQSLFLISVGFIALVYLYIKVLFRVV